MAGFSLDSTTRSLMLKGLLLSCCVSGVSGAVNVFLLRDYVAEWPTGTFLMTFGMMILTIGMEVGFHSLEHSLNNRYAKDIYHHISGELKMLGILSLGIVASQNFLPNTDAPLAQLLLHLFEWAHMVLFVFALLLVLVVGIFFQSIRLTWVNWVRLEKAVTQCPELLETADEDTADGNFFLAMKQFRHQCVNVDENFKDISFCRYLKKKQRANLQYVVCMNWKSWLALIAIAGLNFIRGMLVNIQENWGSEEEKEACQLCPQMVGCMWRHSWPWNVVLYIAIVGYLPLTAFFAQTYHLSKQYQRYLKSGAGAEQARPTFQNEEIPNVGDNSTMFWRSADFELQLIQWAVVSEIYYLAVLFLSMTMECFDARSGRVGEGAMLFFAGLTPPFLFVLVCPSAMQYMTVLSSTGNLLDREVLQGIQQRDEDDVIHAFGHSEHKNPIYESDDTDEELRPKKQRDTYQSASILPVRSAPLTDLSETLPDLDTAQTSFAELMMRKAQEKL